VLVVCWGYFTLTRIDGLGGDLKSEVSWRWDTTAEERFLAEKSKAATGHLVKLPPVGPEDWPEFRGPQRDSRLSGVKIATDWNVQPPKLLWKHRIGPGWSSFAVVGDYAYTQEQRGEDEATVCYYIPDGSEIWAHLTPGRFWEVVAGAGPRATPTYHDGRIYAFGANGLLVALDAATGRELWKRNVQQETAAVTPQWGFSASPLVIDDKVIVIAGGPEGKGTAAYRTSDGEPAWYSGLGKHSYTSAQRAKFDGIDVLLSAHEVGLEALNPTDGKTVWSHTWDMGEAFRIVQPYVFADGRVLLASGYGFGSRLLNVRHTAEPSVWQADEVWTSKKFNPYYNDFVVYDGHAYGFDGNIFCCINLADGERPWKKGRYGYGQVLLLADQGLLLVLGDEGQAVLVEAKPDALHEVGRFQALAGKTWNHPVVTRGKLLVRNAEEAACYELRLAP
jgi:outer membrane protein assembly factor BamB